jgi:Homeodomain-like domain
MGRPPQIVLQRESRTELERLLAYGNTAHKIVKRARIVMSADGHGVMAIMREAGISKTTIWRWQEYFVEAGVMDSSRAAVSHLARSQSARRSNSKSSRGP